MTATTYFSAHSLSRLRRSALKARELPSILLHGHGPGGWIPSPLSPLPLLQVFKHLRLKAGWTLHAYQYVAGGNGNGLVFALPEGMPLPHPSACPTRKKHPMEPPWPPKAIDFLDVLAMDGTPQGYMEASLFAREAGEFGAMWHGVWWEDHTVLDATPNVAGPDWVWAAPVPTDWRPSVTMGAGEVQVSFLTYCDLGQVHLTRFVDRYVPEQGCRFTAESTRLAGGPGGKIY